MAPLTFRNSRIVYYGPNDCPNCGIPIVKMGTEWGGTSFTYPKEPVYPNTEWHPHVCDPALIKNRLSSNAEQRVKMDWPNAFAYATANGKGFVILAEPSKPQHALAISPNCTYFETEESAWIDALRRQTDCLPTWHIDLERDVNSRFTDDLQRLPECPHDN
jgi:hypothetical protein